MKSKFEFRPVERTFSDPIAAQFKPGAPFGREYSRGDIVLLHPEISSSKVFLNSKVLRDAILSSKEYLEEALGLVISDAHNVEEVKEEPKKETKKRSKKADESVKEEVTEVTIEGVNEIPENAEVAEEVIIDAPAEVAEVIEGTLHFENENGLEIKIDEGLILEEEPLNKEE